MIQKFSAEVSESRRHAIAQRQERDQAAELKLLPPRSSGPTPYADLREVDRRRTEFLGKHGPQGVKAAFPTIWPELWPELT